MNDDVDKEAMEAILSAFDEWLTRFVSLFQATLIDLPNMRARQAEARELGNKVPLEILLDIDLVNASPEFLMNTVSTMQLVVPQLIREMMQAHGRQTVRGSFPLRPL